MTSLQRGASRLAHQARNSINDTAAEFQNKGVSGILADTAETVKDASHSAKVSLQNGMDAAANWMAGDDIEENPALPARPGPVPRGPIWKPPVIVPPPKLEELRKGTKVFRKGAPAQVVKIDYEADPPALVVRMLDGGNEVGTDAAHVSLDIDASTNCLSPGIRIIIVELQGRKELNGCRGTLLQYKADVFRWNVEMDSSEVISAKPRNLSVLLQDAQAIPSRSQPSSSSSTTSTRKDRSTPREAAVGVNRYDGSSGITPAPESKSAPSSQLSSSARAPEPVIAGSTLPASSSQPSHKPLESEGKLECRIGSEPPPVLNSGASFLGSAPQEVQASSMVATSSDLPPPTMVLSEPLSDAPSPTTVLSGYAMAASNDMPPQSPPIAATSSTLPPPTMPPPTMILTTPSMPPTTIEPENVAERTTAADSAPLLSAKAEAPTAESELTAASTSEVIE